MEEIKPTITDASLPYASFWRRFFAYLIDYILVGTIAFAIGFSIGLIFGIGSIGLPKNSGGAAAMTAMAQGVSVLISIALTLLYYTLLWTKKNGQTLGNKILAIQVIKEDKTPISFGSAILRYFGYILSGLPLGLGFLWMLWDDKKQGWHDKMAGTLVVETSEKPKKLLAGFVIGCPCLLLIIGIIIFGASVLAVISATSQKEGLPNSNGPLSPPLTPYQIERGIPK